MKLDKVLIAGKIAELRKILRCAKATDKPMLRKMIRDLKKKLRDDNR